MKNMHKLISILLSASMVLGIVQMPIQITQANQPIAIVENLEDGDSDEVEQTEKLETAIDSEADSTNEIVQDTPLETVKNLEETSSNEVDQIESITSFENSSSNAGPEWTRIWSDEFDGGVGSGFHRGLDLSVWEIQTGNGVAMGIPGWGNGEIQYYHGDNVWVDDGMLHIEARLENRGSPGEGDWRHTSGRIRSVGTEGFRDEFGQGMSVKYGRIEASISLPVGTGLWPAFWMMPTDDVYGGWAASGEIDIMEARGREPYMSTAAVHYGGMWPHNTHSHSSIDLRDLDPDLTINDFILYSVEWEPGELRFFVNNHNFWTINDWHSLVPGQEALGTQFMFPAPFDQYFHVILNLAIGGWFDGGVEPDDELFDEARLMRVDYVRVYELTGREMLDPTPPILSPEEIPGGAKQLREPGGLIWDTNFENVIRQAPLPGESGFPTRDGWELFAGDFGGGIAGYDVVDSMLHIQIATGGGVVHANQLMQRTSLVRGRHYRLSFDARAAGPRSINARLSQGANPGWIAYTNFTPNLTANTQTFTHYFTMTNATNLDARLEFNMGGSAHDIWLGNVSLAEVDYVPEGYQGIKTPLPNGNMVWNGTFDQGRDGLIFWSRALADNANLSVHHSRRRLEATGITSTAAPYDVMISQGRIPFANDTFRVNFDRFNETGTGNVGFRIVDMAENVIFYEATFDIAQEAMQTISHEFTLTDVPSDNREMQVQFLLGDAVNEVFLDNIRIERLTEYDRDFTGVTMHPLDNGDFFAGMRSWEYVSEGGGAGSPTIANGVATVDVAALGSNPWSVMLMNEGMQVHSGFTYAVEFDVSATANRNIQLVVETPAFARRLQPLVPVTSTSQRHRFEFTSAHTEILDLKFLMGTMEDATIGSVNISNVQFYIVGAPLQRIPTFITEVINNFVGEDITLTYNRFANPTFSGANATIDINGELISFTHIPGEITIAASYFTGAPINSIRISVYGYESITLHQEIRDPEAIPVTNFLINGDFAVPLTGPEAGWWFEDAPLFTANWYEWLEASHRYSSAGGIALDLPNAGYESWHVFLHQTLAEILPIGEYELTFTARSTRERDVFVEFGPPGTLQQITTIGLTSEWQTFTINVTSAQYVRFLVGYVGGGAHNHTVYIQDVRLGETVAINFEALENLLSEIEALDLDATNFTTESWATFSTALAHARAIFLNEEVTQLEIDDAVVALQNALVGLVQIEDDVDPDDNQADSTDPNDNQADVADPNGNNDITTDSNRPNLPQTGAVIGTTLLGGFALATLGVIIGSKKKGK